jgi:Tol biopolymer transport system component
MTLSAGTKLGPYEIVAPLGAGGMGEVYRAKDARLGRDVAIKVLPERFADDAEAMGRFEREARAVAGLSHPNILALHDAGQHEGVSFAVMELLEGQTLRDELQEGKISPRKAADYARQIADGLAAAHEKGVVHRDLKPENLFVTHDGRVKILDFGLARLTPFTDSSDTHSPTAAAVGTEPGAILGTVGYMSPEQVRGKAADARSDIFSLGAVLYEMLTGRRAFARETAAESMTAVLREEPEEIAESGGRISAALDHIVRRCLEKKPEQRFQSARDLSFAISEAGGSSSSSVSGTAGPASAAPPLAWRRVLWPAAALVVGAAAFLGGRRLAPSAAGSEGWRFQRLTFGANAGLPSISPDGSQFLFVRREGRNLDIFLQRVGGQNAIDLTRGSGFDNDEPAFSPDGARIAFRSERSGGGIFVMGATGESVRPVADEGFSPAWSPDGSTLAYTTTDGSDPYHLGGTGDLVALDVQSGKKRVLVHGEASEAVLERPDWSPHGVRIAVFGLLGTGSQRDIFTIDASRQKAVPVHLTNDKPLDWAPVWAPDGRSLYFGSDRGGTTDLYRIGIDETTGRATSAPERIAVPAGAAGPFSLSRDGSRIAFEVDSSNYGVQRFAFDPVRLEIAGPPTAILSGLSVTSYLALSPDGKKLIFQAGLTQENLYTCDASGHDVSQVTDDQFKNRQPRWLSDGKRVLFYSTRGGPYQLWEIGIDGSRPRVLTPASIGQPLASVPTADGERLATMLETPDSLGFAILRRQADGTYSPEAPRRPAPPASSYAFPVSWSPGGRFLLITGAKGAAIYEPETGAVESIGPKPYGGAWLSDDLLIYGDPDSSTVEEPGSAASGTSSLILYDRTTKKRRVLYRFPADISFGAEIDISPDRRSLYVGTNLSRSDVWMMERNAGK